MVTRRMIIPAGMENIVERYHYAPGVLVGDTLFVSGQVGRDESLRVIEDKEAQFEQVFRNIGKVLDAAGFSFADIVELESWFTSFPGDLPLFMSVKDRWIKGPVFPTWTGFQVSNFSMPGIICEVKVTAIRGDAA
ncbi:MAG: RidA family protein [Rhizobiales bacterium]|nr:RidA family protein [Hyphomicrobiales bacterium]